MSKRVKAKEKTGRELWLLGPNIRVYSFAKNSKKVTFLEIFYFFAQILVNTKKKLTKTEEEKVIEIKKRALIELDNKVSSLKFFANEIRKQGKILLRRKDNKKKIYDYSPYQTYLAMTEGYLNSLHSIWCFITDYDKLLNKTFAKDIKQEEWFKIDIDLRNIFHHNQSPLLSVENEKAIFTFERLPRDPQFFTHSMKNHAGYYQVYLEEKDLAEEVLNFLNKWAKKYIDLINENEKITTVTGFHKDGRIKTKKVTLKELKLIAHTT